MNPLELFAEYPETLLVVLFICAFCIYGYHYSKLTHEMEQRTESWRREMERMSRF